MNLACYDTACAAIDRANADDPSRHELLYSRRMIEWISQLAPDGSEELRLAARAQHIRRWTIPRSQYPEGRSSYLQWREMLKRFHAETLAAIMRDAGYGDTSIAKATTILIRKNLADAAEGQTLEDAACLVFLQFEFDDFARKTPDDKLIGILRKTWQKMSAAAREHAGSLLAGEKTRALLERALA